MITIKGDAAADTLMDTYRQRFLLAMPTLRAVLACIGRVHRDVLPTSVCCFVGEVSGKLRPRGILNTLGQTVVMHHPVDRQIFDSDEVASVNDTPALLVTKIAPPIPNALMHARNNLATLPAFRRALWRSRKFALGTLQVFLISTQKLRARHLLTRREGGRSWSVQHQSLRLGL